MSFGNVLSIIEEEVREVSFHEWLVKLMVYLEKLEKRVLKRKKSKLRKLLLGNESKQRLALDRLDEHSNFFDFKKELYRYVDTVNKDLTNLINLMLLGSSADSDKSAIYNTTITLDEEVNGIENLELVNSDRNVCDKVDDRFKGKFVNENVINLSGRSLSEAEISLLSKGLKFVPTPNNVKGERNKKIIFCMLEEL